MTYVGQSVATQGALAKLTGTGRFAPDMPAPPGSLHAAVLRSPVPHARVRGLDVAAARSVDGVHVVLTRRELGLDDRVRQYGDVLAAVAAESALQAQTSVGLISYDLEELSPVTDPADALDAPPLYNDREDNVALELDITVGDPDAAFAAADVVLEEVYETGRPTHCNLGRHCCLARVTEDGTIEVMTSVDSPMFARDQLAKAVGLEPEQIRLELPELLTSSFGGRSEISPLCEPIAVRLAQHARGRPVRLLYEPEEEFVAGHTRHAGTFRIRSAATRDGRLTVLDIDVLVDHGPFPNFVARIVLANCRDRAFDLYSLAHARFRGRAVLTNNINAAEMRGIGVTQFTFVLASHMDELAHRLGQDPVDFHRRNAVSSGRVHPVSGAELEEVGLAATIEAGVKAAGWVGPDSAGGDRPGVRRGRGMAVGTYTTGLGTFHGPDESAARLELNPDGTVTLQVAAPDSGQGTATAYAQIAADGSGVPYEAIRLARLNTDAGLRDRWGSVASRGAYVVGGAVRDAAERLRAALGAAAADVLGIREDEVEAMADGGRAGQGQAVTLAEIARHVAPLVAEGHHVVEDNPRSYAAYFADVAVDESTGVVHVERVVAALDVGYALNPRLCEGQITGAVAMGVEYALGSDLVLDEGIPMNASFAEYRVLLATDLPDVEPVVVETARDRGPSASLGIGTPAIVAAAPAICNAIRSATGHRVQAIPLRPDVLRAALEVRQRSPQPS